MLLEIFAYYICSVTCPPVIKDGCHLATISTINERVLPMAAVHKPTWFHKNCLRTRFAQCPSWTNTRTDAGGNISSLWEVSSPILDYKHWTPSWSRFLGSQSAGDISHKPGGRLPLLSTRPAVTFPAKEITPPWPVPNYTACLTEAHRCKIGRW